MPGLSKKETARLLTHVEAQGVQVTDVKNGVMLRLPNGESTVVHYSVSDHRGPAKLRSQLKRAGVTWPTDGDEQRGLPTHRAREVGTTALANLGNPDETKIGPVRDQFAALGWENPTNGTLRRVMLWLGYEPVGATISLRWVKPHPIIDLPVAEPEPEPAPLVALEDVNGPDPATPAAREFIDTHDSTAADLDRLADYPIATVRTILEAVGLAVEVRVWRP